MPGWVAEQAAKTSTVIDEAMDAGLAADHPVTIAAQQVRLELRSTGSPPWSFAYAHDGLNVNIG